MNGPTVIHFYGLFSHTILEKDRHPQSAASSLWTCETNRTNAPSHTHSRYNKCLSGLRLRHTTSKITTVHDLVSRHKSQDPGTLYHHRFFRTSRDVCIFRCRGNVTVSNISWTAAGFLSGASLPPVWMVQIHELALLAHRMELGVLVDHGT